MNWNDDSQTIVEAWRTQTHDQKRITLALGIAASAFGIALASFCLYFLG